MHASSKNLWWTRVENACKKNTRTQRKINIIIIIIITIIIIVVISLITVEVATSATHHIMYTYYEQCLRACLFQYSGFSQVVCVRPNIHIALSSLIYARMLCVSCLVLVVVVYTHSYLIYSRVWMFYFKCVCSRVCVFMCVCCMYVCTYMSSASAEFCSTSRRRFSGLSVYVPCDLYHIHKHGAYIL